MSPFAYLKQAFAPSRKNPAVTQASGVTVPNLRSPEELIAFYRAEIRKKHGEISEVELLIDVLEEERRLGKVRSR